MKRALVIILAACGGTPAPPPAPIKSSVAASTVTTPAPSIEWTGERFALHGLPAIARDRSLVVLPLVENDGGRGYPNLRLEIRSGKDRLIDAQDVLLANEYEQRVVGGKPDGALAHAIDEANHRLGKLHEEHELVEMKSVADHNVPAQYHRTLDAGALRVRYTEDSRLGIVFPDGKAIAIDATPWRAPKNHGCENPDWLRDVYVAPGIDAIIVDIAYSGTDTCWEPADQLHLVTW